MNKDGNLTEIGVQEAYRIAGETVRAANQIKSQDGSPREDRANAAKQKSQELKRFADYDYDTAEFFIRYFRFITGECDFLLSSSQKARLETLSKDLENAISRHAKGDVQKLCEDAKRELDNLPEKVSLILVCRDGVARAHQIEPNHARVLAGKLSQMIDAMRREDGYEAERLFRELADGIRPYLDRELPTANNSIATGLTR